MPLSFRPLSYTLGAEVQGVDLARPLSNSEFDAIHRTFLERGILLFRGQRITREQHIAFSRRFGELDDHASLPRDRHPEHPELLLVTNVPKPNGAPSDSRYTGQQWHSDLSFTPVPSLGSLLRGITIPPVGGDTMFTNMALAYDALSDGMKKLIEGLHGIHTGGRKIVDLAADRAAEQARLNPPIARHQWRADDIVLWDNRCTMHIALGDYADGERRHLERTTVKGTPSGYYLQ